MAKKKTIEITCPHCQNRFETQGYQVVNGTLEETLKQQLLTGEFFRFVCPQCEKGVYHPYATAYQDMEKAFFIVLEDGKGEMDRDIEEMHELFPDQKIRITNHHLDFMEKIHVLDRNLNDKIITYLDYKITKEMTGELKKQKSSITITKVLFGNFDFAHQKLIFGALNDSGKQIFIDTPFRDYRMLAESPRLSSVFNRETEGEYRIDADWARALI